MMDGKRHQKPQPSQAAVMLAPILPGGPVQLQIEAQRRVRGTRSAIVDRAGFGEENNSLSGLAEAIAPVDIFSVHEKLRIEQADPFSTSTGAVV